jgi:hypothetical protein
MSFIGLIVQPRIVALTFIGGRKTYKKVFVFGIWTTFYDVNKILKIRQMAASPPKKNNLKALTLRYTTLLVVNRRCMHALLHATPRYANLHYACYIRYTLSYCKQLHATLFYATPRCMCALLHASLCYSAPYELLDATLLYATLRPTLLYPTVF